MRTNRITNVLSLFLLTLLSSQLSAQFWYDYSAPQRDFDWQLFSPEGSSFLKYFDCEREPAQGWFSNLERNHTWMVRPNRAPVGNRQAQAVPVYVPANVNYVYFAVTDADGQVIIPADDLSLLLPFIDSGSYGFQQNTIGDAYAEAGTGWGNRGEFGWVEGRNGWMISILNTHAYDRAEYGVDHKRQVQLDAAQGLNGIDGLLDPDGFGIFQPQPPVEGFQSIPGVDGLYSVHVLFNDPQNLLLGYVDLDGDLLPDDINGDGVITAAVPGPNGFDDEFPFGDRVRLGVVFDELSVQNETQVKGIEVNAIRRKKPLSPDSFVEMYLGARYLEVDDRFKVLGLGGILSDMTVNQRAANRLVGPQVGFRVTKSSSRWTTNVQARFMAAANFLTLRQNGILADHNSRGGLNGSLLQPGVPSTLGGSEFFNRFSDSYFSPTGEFRIESAVLLTKHLSFKAGWTGMVSGNITRASNTVEWTIPSLGINQQDEALFFSMATAGVEINR